MKKLFFLLFEIVILILQILVFTLLFALLIPHYIFLFIPDSTYIANFILKLPEPRIIISFAFFSGGVGYIISKAINKVNFITVKDLSLKALVTLIATSLFFAYFFWKSFSIFNNLQLLGLVILMISFMIFLPNFIEFLLQFFLLVDSLKRKLQKGEKILSIKELTFISISFLIVITFVGLVVTQVIPGLERVVQAERMRRIRLSLDPRIEKVEPQIVYHSTKVILKGSGFDWNLDKKIKLMSSYGPLKPELWTDSKIIFQIPLHIPIGTTYIWIDKPITWLGKKETTRGNKVQITIISRTNGWDAEDDAYFEQLKYLNKETLKLNGHY